MGSAFVASLSFFGFCFFLAENVLLYKVFLKIVDQGPVPQRFLKFLPKLKPKSDFENSNYVRRVQ